ncbi:hypothetical protein J7E93_33910 [Streptomyces sp. ISL-36]|uniref:hypothetical protein n=1 Tax=Streptomyces sp. ISL-36 TaxID=2819182 RepID=UPI001BE65009|nr:hypothetical protein [Streptomyces sp. ISL-36]MBT2445003.1 hypothetical protein [Streptomyces sp. ISL-36]
MADITKISAYIYTADVANADTDATVYLCIGGREFNLDTDSDDFEVGAQYTYVLGEGANVKNAAYNDPRKPQLDTDDLDRYPVYIRFVSAGTDPAWYLERAIVTVNPDSATPHRFDNPRMVGTGENHRIWLWKEGGEKLYLKRYDG